MARIQEEKAGQDSRERALRRRMEDEQEEMERRIKTVNDEVKK